MQTSQQSNLINPTNSLVKYAHPILVSSLSSKIQNQKNSSKHLNVRWLDFLWLFNIENKGSTKVSQSIIVNNNAHTEDILNSILPPREYTMDQ